MRVNPDKLKDLELEYRERTMAERNPMAAMCFATLARFAKDLRLKCLEDK